MKTSRLPITLFCIVAFLAFEVGVGQEAGSPTDALAWTAINAIGCVALWLFADTHIEIADIELGDLLTTGYHPSDPRRPTNPRNRDAGGGRLYPQVVMDKDRNLVMLHSSEDCYASPFSEN